MAAISPRGRAAQILTHAVGCAAVVDAVVSVLVGSDVPVAVVVESTVVVPVGVGVAVVCPEADKKRVKAKKNSENIIGGDMTTGRGALGILLCYGEYNGL